MSEWKEILLSDIATFSQGIQVDIDKQYTIPLKNQIRFIRIVDYTKDNITDVRYIDNPGEKYIVNEDDLVMIRYGSQTAGKIAKGFYGAIANNTFKITPKDDSLVSKKFLYYYLSQKSIYDYFLLMNASSTMPAITFGMVGSLELKLPPLCEQESIAEVLSSLDDKIDLLHRNNKTLEQLAETLFRQWLNDDKATEQTTLGEYINIQNGYAFKSSDFLDLGNNAVIKIKNIDFESVDLENTQFVSDTVVKGLSNKFLAQPGSFLIAMTGAEIGKIGLVGNSKNKMWINQRVGMLIDVLPNSSIIGYMFLKSLEGQDHIITTCTGSAQENISALGIEAMVVPKKTKESVLLLGEKLVPLFKKKILNLDQIQKLVSIRDELLPKLMSGAVKIFN